MRIPCFVTALVLAGGLAGCGGGEPAPTTSDGLRTVRVSTIGVSGAAAMVLGVRQGFFREAGLDVRVVPAEAPAVIPSLLSGDAEFGFLNAPAVLLARSNGVPVVAVSNTSANPADPAENNIQLQVAAGSPIRAPKELEGRTVAVDTLFQLPHLSILNALASAGADVTKVKFSELPFPAMADALKAGQVDAILPAEPFVTVGLAAGARDLLSGSAGQPAGVPQSVFLASEKFTTTDRAAVDGFRTALTRSCEYAQAHPDELRAILPTYTKVAADLAGRIRLPVFTTVAAPEGWQHWADVLTRQQVAKKPVSPDGAYL
ncbi:ABC transporter substrate-binding protein [Actinoplanes sp. NPDC026670]|uniref:ABC transporter substrate-binding protein n=1 Tax=Actinoplanes sp. NPDC026670 TaxID=3154700 RepID=UPI0033D4A6E4